MGKVRGRTTDRKAPMDPVADLKRRLSKLGTAAPGKLRPCIRGWWSDHELATHPAEVGKRIANALIEQRRADAKLAGITILADQLGDHLRLSDLAVFERLFASGHLTNLIIVDGFGTKVLGAMLAREAGREQVARVLATWRDAETEWQRRAACLAFASLAAQGEEALPGLTDLIFMVCATMVWSPDRADQTAVGAVLRALGRAEPSRVAVFFRRYARFMSKECARASVASLPDRVELLAHHKRATTLAR